MSFFGYLIARRQKRRRVIFRHFKKQKMSDIKNGLKSAINVVDHFLKWCKGETQDIIFTPAEISLALKVVMEAAKVLLTIEEMRFQKTKKK